MFFVVRKASCRATCQRRYLHCTTQHQSQGLPGFRESGTRLEVPVWGFAPHRGEASTELLVLRATGMA